MTPLILKPSKELQSLGFFDCDVSDLTNHADDINRKYGDGTNLEYIIRSIIQNVLLYREKYRKLRSQFSITKINIKRNSFIKLADKLPKTRLKKESIIFHNRDLIKIDYGSLKNIIHLNDWNSLSKWIQNTGIATCLVTLTILSIDTLYTTLNDRKLTSKLISAARDIHRNIYRIKQIKSRKIQ